MRRRPGTRLAVERAITHAKLARLATNDLGNRPCTAAVLGFADTERPPASDHDAKVCDVFGCPACLAQGAA